VQKPRNWQWYHHYGNVISWQGLQQGLISSWNHHYILATHTHTHNRFTALLEYVRVSRYQKGKTRKVKTNLDLREQEIVSGSGICWILDNHPTLSFFTGRMPFLPPNQQPTSIL